MSTTEEKDAISAKQIETPNDNSKSSPSARGTGAPPSKASPPKVSHHPPPHLHHHYYPYLPPPYDPAYAIAAAAKRKTPSSAPNDNSKSSPPPPPHPYYHPPNDNSKSSTGEDDGTTSSPSAPPPPHPYYHPYLAWYPPPYGAAMPYPNSNNKTPLHGHPPTGPYHFSDPTLRREVLSHVNSPSDKNPSSPQGDATKLEHPNMAYMMEMEARADGATSPSQIEDFHREEVTSMGCTCKKTKCLKLYCQCFGVKIYCGQNCRCLTCHNLPQYDLERETAIRIILTRNPNAFETKFQKNTGLPLDNPAALAAMRQQDEASRQPGALPMPARILSHKLGCKCRKSACMKKYCECYAGNVKCSSNCRCVGCKNTPPGGKKDDEKPLPGTVSKKDPAWREAAYSLTFLKHGSAEKPARTHSSDKSEAGSMPSLASEESPTGGRGLQRHAEGPKTLQPNTPPSIETLPSSEQTAVNALLMAARSMTGVADSRKEPNAEATTPPIMNGIQNEGSPDESKTVQRSLFTSPKRKAEDTNGSLEKLMGQQGGAEDSNGDAVHNGNDTSPKREHSGDDSKYAKRSRLGSSRNGGEDDETKDDAMEMATPAKGKTGALTELTPVSARCIDFKNMRVSDIQSGAAPM